MTLAEVAVSLVLLSMVGTLFVRTVLVAGRTARLVQDRAAAGLAADAGLGFLTRELALLGGGAAEDLVSMARDSLSYRAVRVAGLACRVEAGVVVIGRQETASGRRPQPGRDSLLILAGGDQPDAVRRWLAAPVLSVAVDSCTGERAPALKIATALDTAEIPPVRSPRLLPVLVFEVMQARIYPSQGQRWLGARSISAGEVIQPVTGPLAATASGFTYFDSVGGVAVTRPSLRRLGLDLSVPWAGLSPGMESVRLLLAPGNLEP